MKMLKLFQAILFTVLVLSSGGRGYARPLAVVSGSGVNAAGPFLVTISQPDATGTKVSTYAKDALFKNWFRGSDIKRNGFHFVRVPVNPVPLLEASSARREVLYTQIEKDVEDFLESGLYVVLDLHFGDRTDERWTPDTIVPLRSAADFDTYRKLVVYLSQKLSKYEYGHVAFEIMNEPPWADCRGQGWLLQQRVLLRDIRAVARYLPVVVTGCGGQLDGLLKLTSNDINMADKNTLFTFHFYEPFVFTHQGRYPEYKSIEGLLYPSEQTDEIAVMKSTKRNLAAGGMDDLSAQSATVEHIVADYVRGNYGESFIKGRFLELKQWMAKNHIACNRVFLGEFAAINWRKADTPAYHDSRIMWDTDVQSVAEESCIGWAFWNLPYWRSDPLYR